MPLRSINPATEAVIQEFPELSAQEINEKLVAGQTAFEQWRTVPLEERAILLRKVAQALRDNKDELAATITSEVGKTLSAAALEVEKCAVTCDYYADHAAEFLNPETIESDANNSYVRFDPIGIVLAVMPWNFPLWQVFRFIAPALMAGNVGVLKHASNVQLSAIAMEEILLEAGLPKGAFQNLAIGANKVESVINDPRVRAVTLTGSEYAGSQVAMQAGKAIKKTVLELGGSDPFIVLKDADLDAAALAATAARMQFNAGQSCIAAKRFIVDERIAETFTEKLVAAVAQLTVGDPTDPSTDVGPLASEQMVNDIKQQVQDSVAKGAVVAHGGKQPAGKGFYYEPTVLTNVSKGMPVYDDEVFGPVLPVITFSDETEAIAIANDSPYGLGSSIFSANTAHAEALAKQIDAGQVFINNPVKSDPRLPFGGVKNSGYGRELSGFGIREFVNIKTVWIR